MLYIVIKRKRSLELIVLSNWMDLADFSSSKDKASAKGTNNKPMPSVPHAASHSINNINYAKQAQKTRAGFRMPSWRKEYVIGLIILALITCYAPKFFETVIISFTKNHCIVQIILKSWVNTLVYLNSSINFLIYGHRDKQILMAVPMFRRSVNRQNATMTTINSE